MKRRKTFAALTALLLTALPGYGLISELAADRGGKMSASAEVLLTNAPAPVQSPSPHAIYTITDLGTLGGVGGGFSLANGINDSGQVVGYSSSSAGPRAFHWQNGTMTNLSTLGVTDNQALGINDFGQVVGYQSVGNPVTLVHAALWQNGTMTNLGGNCSTAFDINNSGQVVGHSGSSCEEYLAFLWQNGAMTTLRTFAGHAFSIAEGINDAGQVVGRSAVSASSGSGSAFLWQNDTITNLGTLGGNISGATAINNSGQVVGYSTTSTALRAFLWQNGTMTNLGTLGGHTFSIAQGINDSGQVVGYSSSSAGLARAFLWQNGMMTDLNTLIPSDSGWVLRQALDINDAGQIVGFGDHNGQFRAFLLTKRSHPLIFIHGAGASVLEDNGEELWLAPFADRRRLSLFPQDHPSAGIEATDAMHYVTIGGVRVPLLGADGIIYGPLLEMLAANGYREYLVNGDPGRRTTAGCDLTQMSNDPAQNPNLFVFAYDWRKDNVGNALKLKDFVGCVEQFHPNAKLDILTHSMGGLLARRYILDYPDDHKVDKLITIGAPWLGAPKLLNVLETGDFVPPVATGPEIKYILPSLTAAHQLLASGAYFALGGQPMFAEEGWDYDGDGDDREIYSHGEVLNFLDTKYPLTTPGTTADTFHSKTTPKGDQDDWRNDSTDVKYFHIYGILAGNLTISQTVATTEEICEPVSVTNTIHCDTYNVLHTRFTVGDGTVPARSAARRSGVGDYNAPNAQLFRFAVSDPEDNSSVEHTGLCSNPQVQNKLLELLGKAPSPPAGTPLQSNPVAKASRAAAEASLTSQADQDDQPSSVPSYYLTIIGGSSVIVSDQRGASTALIAGDIKGSVPNVRTLTLGDKAEMVTMPVSITEEYTVTFRSDGDPVAIKLIKGVDNVTPTDVIVYKDTTLPAGVTAQLKILPAGVNDLGYDGDGDGTFETTVAPTVTLSGQAAQDVTPPAVQINGAGRQIVVDAADGESGVQTVHYSLDGHTFQPYNGPVTVTSAQPVTLHAFADDAAGNRSAPATYTFTPQPPVAVCQNVTRAVGSDCQVVVTAQEVGGASSDPDGDAITLALTPAGPFGVGAHSVTLTATDSYGASASCNATVTVIDNTPPAITCPSDIVVAAALGQSSAVVHYSTTATDNCSNATVTATHPSGSSFPVGVTTVTLTATDAAGTTATCSFTVTVNGSTTQADKIAFDTTRDGNLEIYSMNADGGNPTRLTFNSALDFKPSWSPDRSRIAFTSSRTGNGDIYVMNSDGNNQTRLTSNSAIEDDASWSPDGTKIAFWSSRNGNPEIYVMNADGSNQTRLTSHSAWDTQPKWSPDGTRLAFVSNRNGALNFDIYVMNADGTQVTRLTTSFSIDESPDWSPDGSQIVFTSNRSNLLDFEIWLMNANGSGQTRLTTSTRSSVRPTWSRDGAQITFATNRHALLNFEIYSMNADGTNQMRLTTNSALDFNPDR